MKKRVYEIDYIKLIAMMVVFVCHFVRQLDFQSVGCNNPIIPLDVFGIYIGSFGVSLFFISSGAALMYVYGNKINIKEYFKKRFIGIYPMFWITFILAKCANLLVYKGIQTGIPKWKIIYSILGIDGLLSNYTGVNFYIVGEWFLGTIIILYIIFPFLLKAINKNTFITLFAVLVLYFGIILLMPTKYSVNLIFVTRIPEFIFGMIFIKYKDKFGLKSALISLPILLITWLTPINQILETYRVTIVGITSFLILFYIFSQIKNFPLGENLCKWGSKYSYPFFLVHHIIIVYILRMFSGVYCNKTMLLILFTTCLIITIFIANNIYRLNKQVINYIKIKK